MSVTWCRIKSPVTQFFLQQPAQQNIPRTQHKGPVTRKMFPFDDVIMVPADVPAPFSTGTTAGGVIT